MFLFCPALPDVKIVSNISCPLLIPYNAYQRRHFGIPTVFSQAQISKYKKNLFVTSSIPSIPTTSLLVYSHFSMKKTTHQYKFMHTYNILLVVRHNYVQHLHTQRNSVLSNYSASWFSASTALQSFTNRSKRNFCVAQCMRREQLAIPYV